MNRSIVFMLTCVWFYCLWVGPVRCEPSVTTLACPPSDELLAELSAKKNKLFKLKASLENFIKGKSHPELGLSTLFTIDPNNADQVDKRVAFLKEKLASDRPDDDPILSCALADEHFSPQAIEIYALEKAVSQLRLQFLTLPAEKRLAILQPRAEAIAQADTVKQLQEERSSAVADQKQAAKTLAKAEQKALASLPGVSADLTAERAELERVKNELAALQVKWLVDLEQQAAFYQKTTEHLAMIGLRLVKPGTISETRTNYQQTVSIWRVLVDKTPDLVSHRYEIKLPELPGYPVRLLNETGLTPDARQFRQAYDETRVFCDSLQAKMALRFQEGIESHYRVLLQSGDIRSQLLNQLLARGDRSPLSLSPALFEDIRREFAIVPYRWSAVFYLRWLEIKQNLSRGWDGWRDIAASVVGLAAFLMIPWGIWLGSKHLTYRMMRWRSELVRESRAHEWARHMALAIQKILPYTSWLTMLLALSLVKQLLAVTVFSELALLLPYIEYYIYFRLFRQLMQCDFVWVNQQIRIARLSNLRQTIDIAARTVGLLAFFIFSLLYAIESLIRRGLIFHLAAETMVYLGLMTAFWFAYQWREILSATLTRLVPGPWVKRLAALCNSRFGLVLSFPVFILIVLIVPLRQMMRWSSRFDFFKKIAVEIFRYQLVSVQDASSSISVDRELPEDYLQWFTLSGIADSELLQLPKSPAHLQVTETLDRWAQNYPGNSLAIIGHRGSGKTCLLNYLQDHYADARILYAAIPAKLTTRQGALDFLSRLLGTTLSDDQQTLLQSDFQRPRTLLLIDDAHNLFLAREGGLEAFDAVLELISRPTENLFWCMTFNQHAWTYLNSVYARHQFFSSVATLDKWSETDIQSLISARHDKSGFRLSYDTIIQATGSHDLDDIPYIENRFFRLLWRQSRGNPRLAVYLWLSSLHQISKSELRVGLPIEAESIQFSGISEDALFVYASIERHENLTLTQAVEVTRLAEGIVRHELETGLCRKLLDCRDAVFRVTPLYQYPLINFLLAKHFLYE